MVAVPGGTFAMGATVDRGYGPIDGPTRQVTVAPFHLAAHEVTLDAFRRFTEETGYVSAGKCNVYTDDTSWHIDPDRNWQTPGFAQAADHPVVCVSWRDTQAFIGWLNARPAGNTACRAKRSGNTPRPWPISATRGAAVPA
jgi:formylglycine-generating enzyme required for sulfatase activity